MNFVVETSLGWQLSNWVRDERDKKVGKYACMASRFSKRDIYALASQMTVNQDELLAKYAAKYAQITDLCQGVWSPTGVQGIMLAVGNITSCLVSLLLLSCHGT